MSSNPPLTNPVVGRWHYRSFLNDPANVPFGNLEFGDGTLRFYPTALNAIAGRIGDDQTWELQLQGSMGYGNPLHLRFQGKGLVSGEQWIYDYEGYLSPIWPNGINQVPAITGTVVRTIPHSNGSGGMSPAGVVVSFIAVWIDGNYDAT